jgi:hypothetical protein
VVKLMGQILANVCFVEIHSDVVSRIIPFEFYM